MTGAGWQYLGSAGAMGIIMQADDQVQPEPIRKDIDEPYASTKVGRLERNIKELKQQIGGLERRNTYLEDMVARGESFKVCRRLVELLQFRKHNKEWWHELTALATRARKVLE